MNKNSIKLEELKIRLANIEGRPRAIKSPGVMNKLRRQIRRLEKEAD